MPDAFNATGDVSFHTASVFADIAYAAGHGADDGASQYVLEKLQPLMHFDAAALFSFDSRAGKYQVLGSAGYSPETLNGLSVKYAADSVHTHLVNARLPIRIDKVPYDWRASEFYGEVIAPAGFNDGVGCCLFNTDGALSGMIQMNAGPSFEQNVAELLSVVAPSLGRMTDQREHRYEAISALPELSRRASCIDSDGATWPVRDLEDSTAVHLPGFAEFVRRFLASTSMEAHGLWRSPAGWLDVRVERIRHPRSRGETALLVSEGTTELECELTHREIDVLHKIAQGFSNQRIASDLAIAHRTVTTHVEHMLKKLGQESRAGAVSKAYRDGLFSLDHLALTSSSG